MKTQSIKPLFSILFISAFAFLIAGCGVGEKRTLSKAVSEQKVGRHAEAIVLYSRIAVKPRLRNFLTQPVKNDFCLYYGDPDFRLKHHDIPAESYKAAAKSCIIFANRYPDLSDSGRIQYLSALMLMELNDYSPATSAFIDAKQSGILKIRKDETRQETVSRCRTLYANMARAYSKLGQNNVSSTMSDKVKNECPRIGTGAKPGK